MAKITPRLENDIVVVKTMPDKKKNPSASNWWNAPNKKELSNQLLSTASFLKQQQGYRYRQASIYARLYGNAPLSGFAGSNFYRQSSSSNLPVDRPTMSVITSCIDTLVSRITQSRPRPIFLTDGGNYKQRSLAKQLNSFIMGEFHHSKAHALGELVLRDACVLGSGAVKILEGLDKKVSLERRLVTELLVDQNDAFYGDPRQMYELKLVDRQMMMEAFPKSASLLEKAEQAYPDGGGESTQTASDQIMLVEGWHLPSAEGSGDGLHGIACTEGLLDDSDWEKQKFPFEFLHYSPRLAGLWGQGVAEQLMGTQTEINKLLITISQSINLVGVPRVFVEQGSKVVKSHINNSIGAIVTYLGTKPQYEVAPCVPQELYAQLERLVQYAYQQCGISSLAAGAQKPAGLNSGEAIRNYDDLQTDRFAAVEKRYQNFFEELAYQVTDKAIDIAERDGSYSTVYPDKDGTQQVDLPEIKKLKDNDYVIQCYDTSSLPRDPAGRLQRVTEMMQAGIISPQEGRRLIDYPDIDQVDKLENAAEERIYQILDDIIEDGKFTPPDPFMQLDQAIKIVTQYYNLYSQCELEEEKAQMLRDWFAQCLDLQKQAMPPAPMPMPGAPQAAPMPMATNPMIPNVPQ